MFTCSPQEQIIVEFIKMTPFKNVYMHLIINTVLLPEWSTTVFLLSDSCSWVPCLSRTVNCLLFFRKIFQVPQNLCFSSIFCVFEPFQTMPDFEIHFFTPRTTEGLICNYYRRFKHSLMLQKEKPCIKSQGLKTFEQNEGVYIFLVLLKYHIFSFRTALNAWFFRLEHQWGFEIRFVILQRERKTWNRIMWPL